MTAAVVGVIANLSLWFTIHVLFAETATITAGPVALIAPVLPAFQPVAAALLALGAALLALGAALMILRRSSLPATLAATQRGRASRRARRASPDPLSSVFESRMVIGASRKDPPVSRAIDYGNLMHRAMRGLIREVLDGIARDGLPGAHHFFITFDTMHPDVEIADWLSDRYPDEMTIVIQHWFDNLDVGEDGFAVTLNFGDSQSRSSSPMTPSAPSSILRSNSACASKRRTRTTRRRNDTATDDEAEAPMAEMAEEEGGDAKPREAEVVSLDRFRK